MMSSKYETTKHSTQIKRPLKIPVNFDDAIKGALRVKPPPEGWAKYERKPNRERKQQGQKSTV